MISAVARFRTLTRGTCLALLSPKGREHESFSRTAGFHSGRASFLASGLVHADDTAAHELPQASFGADVAHSQVGTGGSFDLHYKSKNGPYTKAGTEGDIEGGVLRTDAWTNRLIGNLGGYFCSEAVPICFGDPRILHSDGRYVQVNPLVFSLGGVTEAGTTFLVGPHLIVVRDLDRGINVSGWDLEAYLSRTLGHAADISLLGQFALMNTSDQTKTGLFYAVDAKFRKLIMSGWALSAEAEASDAPLKQADAHGNGIGPAQTNTSLLLKGGLTKVW